MLTFIQYLTITESYDDPEADKETARRMQDYLNGKKPPKEDGKLGSSKEDDRETAVRLQVWLNQHESPFLTRRKGKSHSDESKKKMQMAWVLRKILSKQDKQD